MHPSPANATADLVHARVDFEAHRWAAALGGFERAGGSAVLEPEDAERLAWSVTWTGCAASECLDAFERAELAFQRRGDGRGASRAALEQARIHALTGSELVSAACWTRALDHLDGDQECVEYGMVMALVGLARLLDADADGVRDVANVALETGRRMGDPTVNATATYLLGHASILDGDAEEGLRFLDRSMSIALTGAMKPMYAGLIYCGLLWACREIGDWRRAKQWHEVASRWCERESVVHFPAHLSAHRAELARAQGRLGEAEQAALAALDEAGDWHRDLIAWAHAQVGEARLRLGDRDGARTEFTRAAELGYDPEPGHASLLVISGRPEAALRALTLAIERPHWYAFSSLIYTLPVGVSVAAQLGQLEVAERWCDRLSELARRYGTPGPQASALVAGGELALAQGRVGEALARLQDGVDRWRLAEAPYEEARARLALARAYDAAMDPDAAEMELVAAHSIFERTGARGDTDRVRRLLRQRAWERQAAANDAFDGLTPRQQEVAALVALGLTNRQIAERLVVSPYTAETHVKHILARLDFSTRAEIAAWASHKGLTYDVSVSGETMTAYATRYPGSAMTKLAGPP